MEHHCHQPHTYSNHQLCRKRDISHSSSDSSPQKKTRAMNFHVHTHHHQHSVPQILHHPFKNFRAVSALKLKESPNVALKSRRRRTLPLFLNSSKYNSVSASLSPLDLTEDNIKQVLVDARVELGQLFDDSVGMTGQAELADLDGPYVKISLRGKFWHKRSTVLARLGNYLKQRIPDILEVDIEDEKQLDDSPENF